MAYSRCGVAYELHIFPQGRHGLGLAQEILADTTNSVNAPRLLSRGEQQDLVYQALTEAPTEGFFALEHVQERKGKMGN
jgi:hypothetical protein